MQIRPGAYGEVTQHPARLLAVGLTLGLCRSAFNTISVLAYPEDFLKSMLNQSTVSSCILASLWILTLHPAIIDLGSRTSPGLWIRLVQR